MLASGGNIRRGLVADGFMSVDSRSETAEQLMIQFPEYAVSMLRSDPILFDLNLVELLIDDRTKAGEVASARCMFLVLTIIGYSGFNRRMM
jgi:hypothetical protein